MTRTKASWAGFEPAISGVKTRRPLRTGPPGRSGLQCVGQESNLHSVARLLYRQLGSPVPSRRVLVSALDGIRTHDLHRERVTTTPGWSARAVWSFVIGHSSLVIRHWSFVIGHWVNRSLRAAPMTSD